MATVSAIGGDAFGFNFDALSKRQSGIAQAQLDFQKQSTTEDRAQEQVGGMGAGAGTLSGIQKTKDLVKKVRQGPDLVKQAIGNIESKVGALGDQLQDAGRNITRAIPSIPQGPALPDLSALTGGGVRPHLPPIHTPGPPPTHGPPAVARPTPNQIGGGIDMDGNLHGALPASITNPQARARLSAVRNVLAGGADDDDLFSGARNLHQTVQNGVRQVGRMATDVTDRVGGTLSRVADTAEAGLGVAEGVVDTLGPIGDILGMGMGIIGAIKAKHERAEETRSEGVQQRALNSLPSTQQVHTGAVATGGTLDATHGGMAPTPQGHF